MFSFYCNLSTPRISCVGTLTPVFILTTVGSELLHRITVPQRKGFTYGGIYTCTFTLSSDIQLQCHHIFMLSIKGPLFIPPVPLLNRVTLNEPAQRHKTWLSATALKCGNIFKQLFCFILEQSRLQTIVGAQLLAPFDGLTDLWYLIAVCRSQIRTSVRGCWNNTLVVWIACLTCQARCVSGRWATLPVTSQWNVKKWF